MQVAYHQTDSQIGAPPAIHARLPYDKRGDLISISSEDHYIRICTTKGEEMILLRLSDAVREVGDTAGLQVHRSHWIATDHVRMVHKLKDRAEITLSNDRVIPVSRRYLQAVAAAGLFSGKSDG
nr:LytTR family DNA-binding domain-containing protein [Nereida sp. MMG025]